MNYKFKTPPYKHQLTALESHGIIKLMPILWKWVLVKQKY